MRVLALLCALAFAVPAAAAAQGRRSDYDEARRRLASGRARTVRVKKPPRYGPVTLYHVNHHETMAYRPYDAKGRPRRTELRRFNRFMRDARGKVGRMHPRLATLFYRIGQHYPDNRVEVVSGYRPDARNRRSPHRKGLAVDFRVGGVSNAELRDYLRQSFAKVGVGYYPNSVFVHFDVRQRSAFWIDYSGPGDDSVYADDPEGDLRSGRAETFKPSQEPPTSMVDADTGHAGEDAPPPGQEGTAPPRRAEPAPGQELPGGVPHSLPAAGAKGGAPGGVKPGETPR